MEDICKVALGPAVKALKVLAMLNATMNVGFVITLRRAEALAEAFASLRSMISLSREQRCGYISSETTYASCRSTHRVEA